MVWHHLSYYHDQGLLALLAQLKVQFVAIQDVLLYLPISYSQLLRILFFHYIDHEHHLVLLYIELMKGMQKMMDQALNHELNLFFPTIKLPL